MTQFYIPLDEVGEALVGSIWTGLQATLGLVTCCQSLFEPLALNKDFARVFPAVRVMEPSWDGPELHGVNPVFPVVDGRMSFLVAYGRTFLLTDTAEAWGRKIIQDSQVIAQLLWPADMQIPGFVPPDGVLVKRISVSQMSSPAMAEAEDLGVRVAESQIRVVLEVQLRAER